MKQKSKNKKIEKLYQAILKSRNLILEDNAKAWLKNFKEEPWYEAAVKGYVSIAEKMGELLRQWQTDTNKVIRQEQIFTQPIEKAKYRTEEYLDARYNLVVVDDIKDKLIELQKKYKQQLEKLFSEVVAGEFAISIAEALKDTEQLPFNFNKYNPIVRDYMRDKKIHWAKQVSDSTEQYIKRTLVSGYEKGLDSLTIAENIREGTCFSISRAEKVARTESMASCSYADYARFQANGDVIGYKWRCSGGFRSRTTHKEANGQFKLKGQPFLIGGYKMLCPGDGSLGAPAKEVINCRCWLEPVFADEVDNLTDSEKKKVYAPKYVETIDFNDKQLVESKLKEFERNVVNEAAEHAFVILTNGKTYRFRGKNREVHPELLGAALNGAIISHNHPPEETEYSFSEEDLRFLVSSGAKEVCGFDFKYEYVVKINKTYSPDEFEQAYAEARQKARGIISRERYEEDFMHTINSVLAEILNLEYMRRKRK